jgi:hypothetical protein
MFKGRIRLWEFNKNIREGDWAALAILHKIRKDRGKRSTEFLVHDKKKTVADLREHIKGKSMSEDEFLAAALNSAIPDYVRSYTPDPENPEWSPSQSSSEEADVNAAATRRDGRAALQAAAGGGHLEVVEKLLGAKADVKCCCCELGWSYSSAKKSLAQAGHTLLAR